MPHGFEGVHLIRGNAGEEARLPVGTVFLNPFSNTPTANARVNVLTDTGIASITPGTRDKGCYFFTAEIKRRRRPAVPVFAEIIKINEPLDRSLPRQAVIRVAELSLAPERRGMVYCVRKVIFVTDIHLGVAPSPTELRRMLAEDRRQVVADDQRKRLKIILASPVPLQSTGQDAKKLDLCLCFYHNIPDDDELVKDKNVLANIIQRYDEI